MQFLVLLKLPNEPVIGSTMGEVAVASWSAPAPESAHTACQDLLRTDLVANVCTGYSAKHCTSILFEASGFNFETANPGTTMCQ